MLAEELGQLGDGRGDVLREVVHADVRAAADLGLNVYFCDPHSPWQRGSNENTNRLLRQYLAKGIDLRQFSLRDLDDIAARISTRPRRVLDWARSAELFLPRVRAEYVS